MDTRTGLGVMLVHMSLGSPPPVAGGVCGRSGMRWWTVGCAAAAVVLLAGCGASAGRGAGNGASRPASPSGGGGGTSSSPAAPASTAGEARSPSAPAVRCAAGTVDVAVSPGDPVRRELCVRPGAVVRLVLRPREDDKRWTGVTSSAPALVLVSGWQVDPDAGAHATLRCAGTRGGAARITVSAKAPDVAGAPRGVLTLDVNVVPYTRNG
ncbi:hypothetical protein ACF07Y_39770 [Streptomyces sp. NPDC016566]|uniref:hypothetical protein n=1 Tax=unclassified Streptomyces TaxID=2593676 RepID=UPI0036E10FEF